MMRKPMQTLLRASLCAALVPLTSLAQEPEPASAPLTVSAQELVLAYYRPLHHEAEELARVAGDLFGRQFWVREHGGMGGSTPVQNIRLLGDQVLVYDLRANTERILAGLREVDARAGEHGELAEVLQEAEVRPRFVRLETIDELLRPSRRKILWEGQQANNYVLLDERGIVLLRDTEERLAALLAAIAAIDVPPPQVRVRFQLLELVPEGAGGEELPEPLARALAELLPGNRFRRVGTAVLETAVLASTVLKARLGSYDAEIVPNAYDRESGTLSTRSCSLYSRGQGVVEQMFQTSVVLHGGELTVLGATGASTVFLVVEVEPRR